MNERIKELMKQASTTRCSGFGETDILDPEKFAKLIVQDCLTIAEEFHYHSGDESDRTLRAVMRSIEKHFDEVA